MAPMGERQRPHAEGKTMNAHWIMAVTSGANTVLAVVGSSTHGHFSYHQAKYQRPCVVHLTQNGRSMTGGEPFIYPDFVGLCQGLTRKHKIAPHSNLADRIRFYDDLVLASLGKGEHESVQI